MNLIKRYINKKKWKELDYVETVDYYLAKLVHEKTSFKLLDIIVWKATKENGIFNYFKFQYKGKYYELYNNELKEIKKIKD